MKSLTNPRANALSIIGNLLLILTCCSILWARFFRETPTAALPDSPPVPVESVLIDPNLRDGDPKAPVVLFVYSDFECPFCASFASQVLPALRAEFVVPGTLQIVFAHFPMERLHEEAVWKSQAAHCAGQQGRFWPAHDLIFRHRASTRESIKADMISSVGLSMPLLDDCLSSDGSMQMIRKSMEEALRFGVNSTPTFFVGTLRGDGSVDVARTSVGMDAAAHLPTDIRDVLRMAGR